jgi:hypothetical protein
METHNFIMDLYFIMCKGNQRTVPRTTDWFLYREYKRNVSNIKHINANSVVHMEVKLSKNEVRVLQILMWLT